MIASPPVDPGGGDDTGSGGPGNGNDDKGGSNGGDGRGNNGDDGDSKDLQAPVPEPATLMLLGGGIAGLALLRRRRRAR